MKNAAHMTTRAMRSLAARDDDLDASSGRRGRCRRRRRGWCRAARCSFGEGLPALDDDAGDRVDDEGEHEQHQAGGDVGAGLLRAVELAGAAGDLRGEGLAAVEDRPGPRRPSSSGRRARMTTARVSPSARPRPSIDGADDAGLAERQHRGADHLPAGRAEGQRALLVGGGRLGEDLAGDRRDDRQDHDREDEAGEGDVLLALNAGVAEERDPAEAPSSRPCWIGVKYWPAMVRPQRP